MIQKQLSTKNNKAKLDINTLNELLERHNYLTLPQLENIYISIQKNLQGKKKVNSINLLKSFIRESILLDNPVWNVNIDYFLIILRIQELYPELKPDLINTNLVLPPWYEQYLKAKSLQLPIKIGHEHLESNVVKNSEPQSWCIVKDQTPIIEPSTPRNLINEKIEESSKPSPNGIIKVRLYPTKYQTKKLNKMLDANRYAWNLLVEKIGDQVFKLGKKEIATKYRPLITKAGINKSLSIASCPEECFDSAYRDIIKAIVSTKAASKAKKERENIGFKYPERLNFKNKKHGSTSIEIRGRSLTYNPSGRTISMYREYFRTPNGVINHHIKMKTDLVKLGITNFEYSCRLTKSGDKFFLMVPYVKKVEPVSVNKVCAMDPGVRTFMTGYDPKGQTFEISYDNEYILKRKIIIKQLQTKLSSVTNKVKRLRIITEIRNVHRKISNYILDLHHKASRMLSENYSEVLLPTFETKEMVKKEGRMINATTANNMMILSHYKFRQLLKHKMDIRSGKLHLCTEEYTSKTCSICGRLNHYLGSSKVFECPFEDCSIVLDRDINAARNIYIKNYNMIGT